MRPDGFVAEVRRNIVIRLEDQELERAKGWPVEVCDEVVVAGIQAKPRSSSHREMLDGTEVTHCIELLEQAAERETHIACLPELYPMVGEAEICSAARSLNIWVVAGLLERSGGNQYYNTATFISNDGEICCRQRKLYPTEREALRGIVPGSEVDVVETPFGRLGAAICSDLAFTNQVMSRLVEEKVDIVFNPAWWFALAKAYPSSVLGRHLEYGVPIVGINIARNGLVDSGEERWRFVPAGGYSTVTVTPPVASLDELAEWFGVKSSGADGIDEICFTYGAEEEINVHRFYPESIRRFPGYFFKEAVGV